MPKPMSRTEAEAYFKERDAITGRQLNPKEPAPFKSPLTAKQEENMKAVGGFAILVLLVTWLIMSTESTPYVPTDEDRMNASMQRLVDASNSVARSQGLPEIR